MLPFELIFAVVIVCAVFLDVQASRKTLKRQQSKLVSEQSQATHLYKAYSSALRHTFQQYLRVVQVL